MQSSTVAHARTVLVVKHTGTVQVQAVYTMRNVNQACGCCALELVSQLSETSSLLVSALLMR